MLLLKGATIDGIAFDYAVALEFDNLAEIRIEMPFSISAPSGNVKIDPEFPVSAAGAILRLLRQTVSRRVY